jgi:hypothetical protein
MRRDAKSLGFLDHLHLEIKWLLKRLLDLKLVWVTRRELSPATKPPDSVHTQIASHKMLKPYFDDPAYGFNEQTVSGNFARGDVCVVTFLNDRLASYSWVRYQPVEIRGSVWADFGPGHRYTVWGYTHPDFRGRHIRGSFGALDELDREQAITHTINYIDTHNFSSLRAEARHGGEIIGLAGHFKVFGRIFTFRSPGLKKYGFKFRYSAPI